MVEGSALWFGAGGFVLLAGVELVVDVEEATGLPDDAIAWCAAPEAGPELRTLGKTLTKWRRAILAHHTTGASNGPVEAANLLIKHVKRSGRGFRNHSNYRCAGWPPPVGPAAPAGAVRRAP